MTRYSLDTNCIRPILRGNPRILQRVRSHLDVGDEFVLDAITYYETKRGLLAAGATAQMTRFESFSERFGVLMLDRETLDEAAKIYALLKERGRLIEDADLLIGAQAVVHNLVVISRNVRHLERIPNLRVENWIDEPGA